MASNFQTPKLWNAPLRIYLILLSCITFVIPSSASGISSNEFIKTSCSTTIYQALCITSLSTHASTIQTSPKLLALTALSITLETARSTSTEMLKLSQGHGLRPREVAAVGDCLELLSDSVDNLRDSLEEMSRLGGARSLNFRMVMSDVQTWVSAALTDDDTCLDGFAEEGIYGQLKNGVRGRILNVAHLTSNALALINSFASLHG